MFTIEVKKKRKDEEFILDDLDMFHQECGGGEIRIYSNIRYSLFSTGEVLVFECWRCRAEREIRDQEENRIAIVKIALKGGELKLERGISIVQKKETK